MGTHEDEDGGFRLDLPRLVSRRRLIALGGAAAATGAVVLWRAGPGLAEPNRIGTGADGSTCVALPAETPGPFPGDGTNRRDGQVVNVLTEAGVLREDLRPSFAGLTPEAGGVALALEIRLVDVTGGCAPLAGHALYLWHCDAEGKYSLYSRPEANYLRGLGVSDAGGLIRFRTIYPGTYPGRWPHLHFEVFADAASAVNGAEARLTSQFALPQDVSEGVYRSEALYAESIGQLARLSLGSDGIFGNNTAEQLAAQMMTLTSGADGLIARATVGLAG